MTASPSPSPATTEASRLADQVERSFRGGAWHGPAFAETLAGVDAGTAARRPLPAAHTIWEIVGHVSIWLDLSRRRIENLPMPDLGADDDWPVPAAGEAADEAWRRELATLEERYRRLQATLADLDDARLDEAVPGADPTVRGLLLGLLQHHAYHGGQIALLRRAGGAA